MTGTATNHKPLVTVLLVCHDQAQYVEEALDGIRNQTYKNIQLVVADDCSNDNSAEVIRNWISQHGYECTFIENETNIHISKTLNKLLPYAKGDYYCVLAADDVWERDKLERQIPIMESLDESYGIIYSDAVQIDENGDIVNESYIADYRNFDTPPEGEVYNELSADNWIPVPTTMARASVYKTLKEYDERLVYEDWDFWLRAALQYKFKYMADYKAAKYRILQSGINRKHLQARSTRAELSDWYIFLKHIRYGRLQKAVRDRYTFRMSKIAKRLYWKRHPLSTRVLYTTFMLRPSARLFVMLVKSLFVAKQAV